jgi:mono/diheme cytochrome c family protein
MMRLLGRALVALVLVGALGLAWVWFYGMRDGEGDEAIAAAPVAAAEADLVARGAYLAHAGNCMLCHTTRGGAPFAGGRAIATPFGTVYASNLTPDPATGLGQWTADDFWRALHHGRSRDGRLLIPAFPYTSYTQVTRADADALFAYLRSQPAVARPNTPHQLRWPYDTQLALAGWRALYFKAESFRNDSSQSVAWNRGAYLVRGLGHCNACHTTRNVLGGFDAKADLGGGAIPMQNWYAPSLASRNEASVADWDVAEVVGLLKSGISHRSSITGPMAEVVQHSTQYLSDQDLAAMAQFLKALPQQTPAPAPPAPPPRNAELGARLYTKHCAACHGDKGEGVPGAYPPLAGNRAITMASPTNLVHIVLRGGFPPSTTGNPRPYGMPPFVMVLSEAEVAAVLSHVRSSWGNHAAEVTELEVSRYREEVAR